MKKLIYTFDAILLALTLGLCVMAHGWVYLAALVLFFGARELAFYSACRHHQSSYTLPYWIPLPTIMGTFGGVRPLKGDLPSRRALFDMVASSVIAGFIVACLLLWLGLRWSSVQAIPKEGLHLFIGQPWIMAWLSKFIIVPLAPHQDFVLHPVAWAGWTALFVTGVHLLPVGLLDGGHLVTALAGQKATHVASWLTVLALLILAIVVHPIWYALTAITLLFIFRHATPWQQSSSLTQRHYGVAILLALIAIASLMIMPFNYTLL